MKKSLLLCFLLTSLVFADETGVSTEAISLPSLPGTVEGMPGSIIDGGNKGDFSFKLPIKLPAGVNKHTPTLELKYSSGSGQSEFGQGWSLDLPTISYNIKKGVPRYDGNDTFWGLAGELVEVSSSKMGVRMFAPYINPNQDLYEYDDVNQTWIVHQGNGKKLYFGTSPSTSLIKQDDKTFKWFIEKNIDTSGNEINYEYTKIAGFPYLTAVRYAYKSSVSHYRIEFDYEDRQDLVENFKSSFKILQSKRCSEIRVISGTDFIIRSYKLNYEEALYSKSSRLIEVKQHGEGGLDLDPAMPSMVFSYHNLDLEQSFQTQQLSFADSAVFPPSLSKSRATLVDINQDSFPDLIETATTGAKVWLNDKNDGFLPHYSVPEFISVLGTNQTKLLDVDGDRIVDFVSTGLYSRYHKGGAGLSGDRVAFDPTPSQITALPSYSLGQANVKTIDINGNGRLDIFAREINGFKSFLSSSTGSWDQAVDYIVNTGAFDISSRYFFVADMNGDGLNDLVFARPTGVIFLANKGTGEFDEPKLISNTDKNILGLFRNNKFNFVIDIDKNGFADLVSVWGEGIAIALNQGDGTFSETFVFHGLNPGFDLKGLHITSADINGNGTQDILWSNDFHDYRYLDFSDGKTNLLNFIDHGLGLKTHISYALASSFADNPSYLAASLPFPQMVVSEIKETLGVDPTAIRHEDYAYFGGFYQPLENDFRGFNGVQKIEHGDISIDGLVIESEFEQGRLEVDDPKQFSLRRASEYVYEPTKKALGPLLRQSEYSLGVLNLFDSLSDKNSTKTFAAQTIFTEGDEDLLTADRQHKEVLSYTLSLAGVIEKETRDIYLDLSIRLRSEEKHFAVDSIATAHLTNRICSRATFDDSANKLWEERYYFDGQALCELTQGLQTSKEAWTGSGYETKASYTYKGFGALASFSDSFSQTTTIDYDVLDLYPVLVTNPASHTRSATYDSDTGLITSSTDENSRVTNYVFDLYQRLTKIIGPADSLSFPTNEIEYTFGSSAGALNALVVKAREKSGVAGTFDTKEYFDGKGRSLAKIYEGPASQYVLEAREYNLRGEKTREYQKSFVSNFNFPSSMSGIRLFATIFDALKRPRFSYNPEHEVSDSSFKEFVYKVGETTTIDEEGNQSVEYFDALARRVKNQDANLEEVLYSFNELDLMTQITDPQGSLTKFSFDTQKRRVCKLDPTIGVTTYVYNSENLMTQKNSYGYVSGVTDCVAPIGVTPRTIDYEYSDNLNRMTKIDFPIGSSTEDILFSYDEISSSYGKGQLTSVDFGVGQKSFDFDIYGNQSEMSLSIDSNTYTTQTIFDVFGRIEQVIYPTISGNSLTIDYGHNEATQIAQVENNATSFDYVTGVTYSPLGQISTIEFGNNVKSTLTYDDTLQSYRLSSILTEKIGTPNTTIQEIAYEYSKVDNVTERDDVLNSFTETYGYDDLYRLTSANLGGTSKTWAFDEIGNITANNGVAYTYNSNRKQIVDAVGLDAYSFDVHGNIASDASRSYVFDWSNRLRSVTKSAVTTTYDYDHKGIRVKKATPSETTIFIDRYTELRGSNVIRHIFANDKRIASIDELGFVTYNHEDHLTSSNLRTDSTGSVVKRIEYNPFGSKRAEVGSYDKIKNRYTGQYEDEESELLYYQQRYYDPILSRFISADPLYLEGINTRGINAGETALYSYVGNRPLIAVDPTGEVTQVIFVKDSILGAKFGSHAAIRVDNNGSPVLYDPGGSYQSGSRGSGGFFGDKEADLSTYAKFHKDLGSEVKVIGFDTTPITESKIFDNIEKMGDVSGGLCTAAVCGALQGTDLEPTETYISPDSLEKDLQNIDGGMSMEIAPTQFDSQSTKTVGGF